MAENKNLPPYAPFDAVISVIDQMAKTFVPTRIDQELTKGMSNGTRSHVLSSMRYLGLIDNANHPRESLETLVNARKTGEAAWAETMNSLVKSSYAWAFNGLDIERVTSKQLRERFRDAAGADGLIGDRAVRFFLKALKDANIEYSPHLNVRRPRGSVKRASKTTSAGTNGSIATPTTTTKPTESGVPLSPPGMITFPVFIKGKTTGSVIVPDTITPDECAMLDLALQMVKAYAAQNT